MSFGAIADDLTGATDLASLISRAGRQVVLSFGLPGKPLPPADAVVVATKSRMLPPHQACDIALQSARFLSALGIAQLYFKYCSTFDSTEKGNIGPVIETLLACTGTALTLACPSYPAYARTVYQGHLFVGDRLISESSMRNHPLTPMTDPDLVRFLGRQCRLPIGLLALKDVDAGAAHVGAFMAQQVVAGRRVLIADAVLDRHIDTLAGACRGLGLVTGGAPLGGALAARRPATMAVKFAIKREPDGPAALLSGSCSVMTLVQIGKAVNAMPSRLLDPLRLMEHGKQELAAILDWAIDRSRNGDFLIYSSTDPQAVGAAQSLLRRDAAGNLLEEAFAEIAAGLARAGLRKFVVAGGETSGAVVRALGIQTLVFGEELDPGVPWTYSLDPEGFTLALKSGNFGRPDFFLRAVAD
jgi:uncharacterized protein YgbK (DUF1537 family)